MDHTASFQKILNKKHDATFTAWGITPPFPRYYEGWHSINAYDPGTKTPRVMTNNISVYANPAIDPLAETVRFGTSIEEIHQAAIKAEQIIHEDAAWVPGFKRSFYRCGHWRWMRWPKDFNVRLNDIPEESYLYWIDEDMKKETLKAKAKGETFPEVDVIYDKYKK